MEFYLGAVLLCLAMGLFVRMLRLLRRRNLAPISYVEALETQGFVLFLRAFDEDGAAVSWPTSLFTLTMVPMPYEEELAGLLSRRCVLIAVGRPGEELPPLGARRLYLLDDEWKPRVSSLMERARVIVLSPSLSHGTRWEIDEILSRGHQAKTVCFLWLGDGREEAIRELNHAKLAEYLEQKHSVRLGQYERGARFCSFVGTKSLRMVKDPRLLPALGGLL